jgi:hypothetical protein
LSHETGQENGSIRLHDAFQFARQQIDYLCTDVNQQNVGVSAAIASAEPMKTGSR